ncbi:hypothetical protein IOCL1545_000139100, partial [Leishmania shawi]
SSRQPRIGLSLPRALRQQRCPLAAVALGIPSWPPPFYHNGEVAQG